MGLYTAVTIQPVVKTAYSRADVKENLDRVLTLIASSRISGTASVRAGGPEAGPGYAPVRLATLPEFCLQGEPFDLDFEDRKERILLSVPGPETDELGRLARDLDMYVVVTLLELDERWADRQFNTTIIIAPSGEIILKYRKINPAIHFELSASPHDMMRDYLGAEEMRKPSRALYPVVDTEIGRLGCVICMDGHFPESFRALALNGAEVIVRGNFPEPLVSAPNDIWEVQNRGAAHANLAYVVAPMLGGMANNTAPQNITPGNSMIVDFNGMVVARTPYPGEGVTGAVINIEQLRARRMDPSRNFLSLLRTETFRDIYDQSILPPDSFTGSTPPQTFAKLAERSAAPVVDKHVRDGVFVPPKS